MTPATPPMPMGDIGAGQGPASGVGSLMGPSQSPTQPSPTAQEQAKQQISEINTQIQGLANRAAEIARQFPEFAEAAKAIADACSAGRVKLIANQLRGLEGPPPPNAAM